MKKLPVAIACSTAAALCSAAMLGSYKLFRAAFARRPSGDSSQRSGKRIRITARDGSRLCGSQVMAWTSRSPRLVIAAHGHMSNGWSDFEAILPMYMEMGFDVFMPDMRGHGESDGKYVGFGIPDRLDLVDWSDYFAEKYDFILLHGVSMGAAAVDMACAEKLPEEVRGAVSDCAYSTAIDEFKYVMKMNMHLPAFPLCNMAELWCRALAGINIREASPVNSVAHSRLPILFVHGGNDTYVPTKMVFDLHDACCTKKTLVIVPDANHAESAAKNPELYAGALRGFIDKLRD